MICPHFYVYAIFQLKKKINLRKHTQDNTLPLQTLLMLQALVLLLP